MSNYEGYNGNEELKADGWKLLSECDESESYEVDQAEIWHNARDGRFILRTASGCSCWAGDWDVLTFGGFDLLKKHLLGDNEARYNPSLSGAITMLDEAEAALVED